MRRLSTNRAFCPCRVACLCWAWAVPLPCFPRKRSKSDTTSLPAVAALAFCPPNREGLEVVGKICFQYLGKPLFAWLPLCRSTRTCAHHLPNGFVPMAVPVASVLWGKVKALLECSVSMPCGVRSRHTSKEKPFPCGEVLFVAVLLQDNKVAAHLDTACLHGKACRASVRR